MLQATILDKDRDTTGWRCSYIKGARIVGLQEIVVAIDSDYHNITKNTTPPLNIYRKVSILRRYFRI